jgi:hypothetical protein
VNTDPKYSEKDMHSILKITLDVHDQRSDETGILCATDCVFQLGHKCGLKNVILTSGMCPHYNPNLKNEDIAFVNINPRENLQV